MKALKSLKEFKQQSECLSNLELSKVIGGLLPGTQEKWNTTCKYNCDDLENVKRDWNMLTGTWSSWYQISFCYVDASCLAYQP